MDSEFDFTNAKRGAVADSHGKTRITIFLDNEVLEHFRRVAQQNGRGYQTEINAQLRKLVSAPSPDVEAIVVETLKDSLNDLAKFLLSRMQHRGQSPLEGKLVSDYGYGMYEEIHGRPGRLLVKDPGAKRKPGGMGRASAPSPRKSEKASATATKRAGKRVTGKGSKRK